MYLMCVSSEWNTKSSCQAEISQLQIPLFVNEQILWLQVPMKDPVTVAISHTIHELAHETLYYGVAEAKIL